MFTGSPFVVMGSKYTGPDIGTKVENTYAPYLKFLPTDFDLADLRANMGIVNHQINTDRYAGLR